MHPFSMALLSFDKGTSRAHAASASTTLALLALLRSVATDPRRVAVAPAEDFSGEAGMGDWSCPCGLTIARAVPYAQTSSPQRTLPWWTSLTASLTNESSAQVATAQH
jgi:hypothetical protein